MVIQKGYQKRENSDKEKRIAQHTIEIIGEVYSCFREKFGIPRQPGLVSAATAVISLFPPFNRPEMVRGLEDFSHIWVQFLFHGVQNEGWKPTVRPPRLGGKKRVGVFACRSPHRPNHIGISALKLEKIEYQAGSPLLYLQGVDLLDGTPIIDIKPYIPYSDRLDTATEGFTTEGTEKSVIERVFFSKEASDFCRQYEAQYSRKLQQLIEEILVQDPRPPVQRGIKEMFAMTLWHVNIHWRVEGDTARVERCENF